MVVPRLQRRYPPSAACEAATLRHPHACPKYSATSTWAKMATAINLDDPSFDGPPDGSVRPGQTFLGR